MDIQELLAEMRILNGGRISRYGTVSIISEKAANPITGAEVVVYSDKLRPYANNNYRAIRHAQGIQIIGRGNQPVMVVPIRSFLDFRVQKIGKVLPSGYVIYPKLDGRFFHTLLEKVALGMQPDLPIKRPFVHVEKSELVGRNLVVIEKSEKECVVFELNGKVVPHKITYPFTPEQSKK